MLNCNQCIRFTTHWATTAAMTALGVSGPVGWGVGFGMAALYTAGSTLC